MCPDWPGRIATSGSAADSSSKEVAAVVAVSEVDGHQACHYPPLHWAAAKGKISKTHYSNHY